MATEDDKILESLERWKKRVSTAFLLIASIVGAIALLLLEAGVVAKAWSLSFSSAYAAEIRHGDLTELDAPVAQRNADCSCRAPVSNSSQREPARQVSKRDRRLTCIVGDHE